MRRSSWTFALAFVVTAVGEQALADCGFDQFSNFVCSIERRTAAPAATPPAAPACETENADPGTDDTLDRGDDEDDDVADPGTRPTAPVPGTSPADTLVPTGTIHRVSTDAELRAALSQLQPRDTLLLKSGAIFRGPIEITRSGTASEWIQIAGNAAIVGGDPVVRLRNVRHVRLHGIEISGGRQGIRVERNSSRIELLAMDVHGNERDGVWIGKNANNVLVQDGSMHHNGTIDAAPATNRPGMMNLGHGVLIAKGAHDNVVDGVDLCCNAEDGIQFGPEAGSGNLIVNNTIHGNEEDGIDLKNGNQTFVGNVIYDNNNNGILLHRNGGYQVLIGNVVETRDDGNALEVGRNCQVRSEGNTYTGHQSVAVEITGEALGTSIFKNDTIEGRVRKMGSATFDLIPTAPAPRQTSSTSMFR